MDYSIVQLARENAKDLIPLFDIVFHKRVTEEYIVKKYNTSIFGPSFLGFIAYDGLKHAVGFYGAVPCNVIYRDETTLAAQTTDLMIYPLYRKTKLFYELAMRLHELAKNRSSGFLFAFPNEISLHIHNDKLQWNYMERLNVYTIPVNTLPLHTIFRRFSSTKKLYDKFASSFLQKRTSTRGSIHNSVIDEYTGGILRDADYYDYKKYNGATILDVNGYRVWVNVKNGLWIGDMEVMPEREFRETIRALQKIAFFMGLQKIEFQTSPGSRLDRLFSRFFNSTPGFPVMCLDFNSVIPPGRIKFTLGDIDIF